MAVLESIKNRKFNYVKLTPEEQKSRGILGRLVGIIASTKEPTRNGRSYSKELWENVFQNPIMQEKIKTRCLFGELGHPADRTEIDMEKVAICLAEVPKLGDDGNLYGVFDILDTPNGKILKTFCDYGSVIGVSSRGQGDLVQDYQGNESVDPETYECECWDAVLIPAVESARMTYIKEGLDLRQVKLKRALNESFKKASEEEQKVMKETLNNLNIKLDEAKKETKADKKAKKAEAKEETVGEEAVEIVNDPDLDKAVADLEEKGIGPDDIEDLDIVNDEDEQHETEEVADLDVVDDAEEQPKAETVEVEAEEVVTEEPVEEEPTEQSIEEPVQIEETEEKKTTLEDVIKFIQDNYYQKEIRKALQDLEIDLDEYENKEDIKTEQSDDIDEVEEVKKTEEQTEEANNDGDDVLVDSLKEALRTKSELENNAKILNEKLAVSDSKVDELKEECNRYKQALSRLSLLAKSTKDLREKVTDLTESIQTKEQTIKEKDDEIKSQKERITRLVEARKKAFTNTTAISESVVTKDNQIKTLNESLKLNEQKATTELKALNEKLEKVEKESKTQISKLTEDLNKATTIKDSYKKLASKAVNKYIDVKASMLGMTSVDIKRKLGESYTMEDVDQVCEDLKAYNLNVSKLPFDLNRKVSVKVNESVQNKFTPKSQLNEDDEVDDALIKMANLD